MCSFKWKSVVAAACAAYAGLGFAQSPAAWPVRGAPGSFELGAEGLVWWLRDMPAPVPLVTDGFTGVPGLKTYLGGQDIGVGASGGVKITASYALAPGTTLEGNF